MLTGYVNDVDAHSTDVDDIEDQNKETPEEHAFEGADTPYDEGLFHTKPIDMREQNAHKHETHPFESVRLLGELLVFLMKRMRLRGVLSCGEQSGGLVSRVTGVLHDGPVYSSL